MLEINNVFLSIIYVSILPDLETSSVYSRFIFLINSFKDLSIPRPIFADRSFQLDNY